MDCVQVPSAMDVGTARGSDTCMWVVMLQEQAEESQGSTSPIPTPPWASLLLAEVAKLAEKLEESKHSFDHSPHHLFSNSIYNIAKIHNIHDSMLLFLVLHMEKIRLFAYLNDLFP